MNKRPVEILYVRGDGVAIGEPEGTPKQLAKEASPLWTRVFKSMVDREKVWDEKIERKKKAKAEAAKVEAETPPPKVVKPSKAKKRSKRKAKK